MFETILAGILGILGALAGAFLSRHSVRKQYLHSIWLDTYAQLFHEVFTYLDTDSMENRNALFIAMEKAKLLCKADSSADKILKAMNAELLKEGADSHKLHSLICELRNLVRDRLAKF